MDGYMMNGIPIFVIYGMGMGNGRLNKTPLSSF